MYHCLLISKLSNLHHPALPCLWSLPFGLFSLSIPTKIFLVQDFISIPASVRFASSLSWERDIFLALSRHLAPHAWNALPLISGLFNHTHYLKLNSSSMSFIKFPPPTPVSCHGFPFSKLSNIQIHFQF